MESDATLWCITGLGGFIGSAVAREAERHGATIRGLDVSPDAVERATAEGWEVIRGSVADEAAVREAVEGADVVVNTAAIVKESGGWDEFREVNVRGAVLVATCARDAGASVFVQLSSVMVHGFDFPRSVTEDGPLRGEGNPYCQTKIEGEAELIPLHDPPDFRVIRIRPGDVYGPESEPWVRRPVELMRSGLFAIPSGPGVINPVHVEDLARGIVRAVELSEQTGGEALTLCEEEPVPVAVYFDRLADWAGLGHPVRLPAWAMRLLVRVRGAWMRSRGREPDASPAGVDFLSRPHPYSSRKARAMLGWEPRIRWSEATREQVLGEG